MATGRAASDWPSSRQVPSTYPGAAPDHHHLLVDGRVLPLDVRWRDGTLAMTLPDATPVDDVLARAGSAPLAERVPVLAYGTNRSPHTLVLKFAHHGRHRSPRPGAAAPVLAGRLTGVDVVAAGVSSQGFVYADLTPSAGTGISVLLGLLDPAQAAALHDSEGVGRGMYECALVPGFEVAGTSLHLDVVGYAGCRPVFVSPETGTPLAFSIVPASGRRFPAYEQVELTTHVLVSTGVAGDVADLLGLGAGCEPATVARQWAALVNGQWWYARHTGDGGVTLADRARELVAGALSRHGPGPSTAERMGATGAVLAAEEAYAAGPRLRLGAQVGLG